MNNQNGINCEGCGKEATSIHTYGVYEIAGKPRDIPMNKLCLCKDCGQDLWGRIESSVAAQHMHYQVKSIIKKTYIERIKYVISAKYTHFKIKFFNHKSKYGDLK